MRVQLAPGLLIGLLVVLAACRSAASPEATPITSSSLTVTSVPATSTPNQAAPSATIAAAPTPTLSGAAVAAPPTPAPPNPTATTASRPVPTSSAAPAQTLPTPGPVADDWPTYHRDVTRTGVETGPSAFSQIQEAWRSGALDGDVYAEPLVARGQVIVATENNSVYTFDLASGRAGWQAHLGVPVPRSQLPCGDIDPTGITGTPVVDVAAGRIYAVTFVQPGRHELVALDLATGSVRFRVPIDPSGADPLAHQQRAALTISRGMVYVAFGGLFGDCGDYHGWVVAADAANGGIRATYQVPTDREGGIWAPGGPSLDASGNLFVTTGNGSSTAASRFDYGNAVLRLSPDLHLLDWFAPTDWAPLSRADADVGSVSPALLDNGLAFQIGKAGVGYLLRADRLGQVGGQVFDSKVCSGAFGGTAYQSPRIYVPCVDGLVALRVGDNAFSVDWRVPGFFAGPPIVAAGTVWSIGRDGTLYAIDPSNGQVRSQTGIGSVSHFATPSASGPYLLVPSAREIVAERLQ